MDLEEIKKIIDLLEKSSLTKIHLKSGGDELVLEKENGKISHHLEPSASYQREQEPPPKEKQKSKQEEDFFVTSPMVGTFYTSPAPDQPSFVKIGDKVIESHIVCLIEAMKVMNEVKAGKKGTIIEVLCENAQPVEFGTKLFRIQ